MSATSSGPRDAMRILHVEDDPSCAELVRLALEPDYEVIGVRDAVSALAAIEADPPALILLDLHLPGLPGFELYRRLRHLPAAAALPVVVVSGRVMQDEPGQAQRLGCAAFVEKPFSLADLRRAVADSLAARPASGPTRAPS
jgi:CheY-like chemotaxis protein